MVLLPDGDALAAGGIDNDAALASAEVYSPAAGTWAATGSLATARFVFQMVLLPNGNVLAAGGQDSSGLGATPLASAEVYRGAAALAEGIRVSAAPHPLPFEQICLNVLQAAGACTLPVKTAEAHKVRLTRIVEVLTSDPEHSSFHSHHLRFFL